MVLPRGRTAISADDRAFDTSHEHQQGWNDMLLIIRLPETCSSACQNTIDIAVKMALGDCTQVNLKCRFDAAGPSFGLVERIIAPCYVIGEVERNACWRYGALFKSHAMTGRRGRVFRL